MLDEAKGLQHAQGAKSLSSAAVDESNKELGSPLAAETLAEYGFRHDHLYSQHVKTKK